MRKFRVIVVGILVGGVVGYFFPIFPKIILIPCGIAAGIIMGGIVANRYYND